MKEEERAIITEFGRASRDMTWDENGWFSRLDAAAYFGMILRKHPKLIIEIGSGVSTGIARQAIERGGTGSRLVCVDPEPRIEVSEVADGVIRAPAQTLDPEFYLRADMLFIDSSHVFFQGGELPFLYGSVFPQIKPGVAVHSHDIFSPDDYPPSWKPRGYNEQYHLKAYLERDSLWRVVWRGYYFATRCPEIVEESFGFVGSAGSFWIERTGKA